MTAPEIPDKRRLPRLPRIGRPREHPPVREASLPAPVGEDVMRVAATFAARFLVIVAFLYVLLWLLSQISLVSITIIVAIMLSAILRPMVDAAVRRHVPRWIAGPIVFFVGVGAVGLLMWFVVTQITNNMDTITSQLQKAGLSILEWLESGPAHMSPDQVNQTSTQLAQILTNTRGDVISGTVATATSLVTVLTGSLLCLFSLLFLLLDDGTMWRWVVGLFPASEQSRVLTGGAVAWRTLVAYMRSTILLAFINALTMVPIMVFAGMDLIIPLAVLLFLGSLIPMVGMLVAGAILMLVALVMQGPVTALVIGIALFLVIQLEGNLLNPYILGKAVSIHPLAILATVTGGTLVGGVFGAFVAVPMVAIVNNVVLAVRSSVSPEQIQQDQSGDVVQEVLDDPGVPSPGESRGSHGADPVRVSASEAASSAGAGGDGALGPGVPERAPRGSH
ncbi:MAG: AI-2E family transporter [Dermatophilaceae bacterium]